MKNVTYLLQICVSFKYEITYRLQCKTRFSGIFSFQIQLLLSTYHDIFFPAQVSPSAPIFFQVNFPENAESLLVKMSSSDQICAILSVQNITCPVYDLDLNVQFEGSYQTADTKGK